MYEESNYLEHHGVLGQKWGVRRYQNRKGGYTKAGMARYKDSIQKGNKLLKKRKSISGYRKKQVANAALSTGVAGIGASIGVGSALANGFISEFGLTPVTSFLGPIGGAITVGAGLVGTANAIRMHRNSKHIERAYKSKI